MTNKTIFLFLLSLMIYGTVSVNAQVRIGGNSVPHPSSVLDLNPDNTDAATASGGLLLPHVRLDSVKHTGVFGAGITPTEGLMVYNVDGGKTGRPEKGVYCYMGGEWVPVGAQVAAATPDPGPDPEPGLVYTGPGFSIAVNEKSLWLGRGDDNESELKAPVDIIMPDIVKGYGYPIQYVWDITDSETQQVTSVTTTDSALQIPAARKNELQSGKIYRLSLTVRIYDYVTNTAPAGHIVYGIGAWIGPNQWLTVANANVGATQDYQLETQLKLNHIERPLRTIMGDYFQWGRLPDGHEVYGDELKQNEPDNPNKWGSGAITSTSTVSASDLDSCGQPKPGDLRSKFIQVANSDWREYPDGMTVPGNIETTNIVRKPWYWRTQEDPTTGVDPCSAAMEGCPGEWFVMTRSQWESITEHNRIAELDTDLARGVAIYPNGDSDISFYLPGAAYRDGNHSYLGSGYDWNDWSYFYGWDSSQKKDICLWLNSPDEGDIDKAYRLTWTDTGSSIGSGGRTDGLPIRCVSY